LQQAVVLTHHEHAYEQHMLMSDPLTAVTVASSRDTRPASELSVLLSCSHVERYEFCAVERLGRMASAMATRIWAKIIFADWDV